MKERSYRQVEALRQQNRREQRRLEDKLNSRQGLNAIRQYSLDQVSREQDRVRKELAQIHKLGVTTTLGHLPPRDRAAFDDDNNNHGKTYRRKRRRSKVDAMKEREREKAEQTLQEFNEVYMPSLAHCDSGNAVPAAGSPRMKRVAAADMLYGDAEKRPLSVEKARTTPTRRVPLAMAELDFKNARKQATRRLAETATYATATHASGTPDQTEPLRSQSPSRTPAAPTDIHLTNDLELGKVNALAQQYQDAGSDADIEIKSNQPLNTRSKRKHTKKNLKGEGDEDVVEFDSLRYNADGSLRTLHSLPDPDVSFAEARKARYVRQRGRAWFEREFSVSEIFTSTGSSKQ